MAVERPISLRQLKTAVGVVCGDDRVRSVSVGGDLGATVDFVKLFFFEGTIALPEYVVREMRQAGTSPGVWLSTSLSHCEPDGVRIVKEDEQPNGGSHVQIEATFSRMD
jgi:hypothetical protein